MPLIEVTANNPIGLTDPNFRGNLYAGQSGDITSGLGVTFATFPDPATGIAAGLAYLQRHASESIGQLVAAFGGNTGPAAQGFDMNAQVGSVNLNNLEAALAQGEGTLSAFGGPGAFSAANAGSLAGASAGQAAGAAAGSAAKGAAGQLGDLINWLTNIGPSVLWVVIGIVVLIGALYAFAVQQGAAPSPKEVAAAAVAAA